MDEGWLQGLCQQGRGGLRLPEVGLLRQRAAGVQLRLHGRCADPLNCADGGIRFNEDERWTCLLQKALGDDYLVTEEGLSGRTTVFSDPVDETMDALTAIYSYVTWKNKGWGRVFDPILFIYVLSLSSSMLILITHFRLTAGLSVKKRPGRWASHGKKIPKQPAVAVTMLSLLTDSRNAISFSG